MLSLDGRPVSTSTVRTAQPWRQTLHVQAGTLDHAPVSGRVPWIPGTLEWEHEGRVHRTEVVVDEDARPSQAACFLLRRWNRGLARLHPDRVIPADALDGVPLFGAQALEGLFELTELDRRLETDLGDLVALCLRPRTWLRVENAWTPLERVRRPARRADMELARRGQGRWYGGRFRPDKLLAEFREDQLDLYENRVAIGLARALRQRAIRRLERFTLSSAQVQGALDTLDRAYRLGQWRRYGKLRKAAGLDPQRLHQLRQQAEEARAAMEQQLRLLKACHDSPLEALPSERPPLRRTNILTFDQRYQQVQQIWRLLEEERRQEPVPDPVLDDVDQGYADFCQLAVLRALAERGHPPTQAIRLADGEVVCRGGVVLARRISGLTLTLGEQAIALSTTFCSSASRHAPQDHVWLHPNEPRRADTTATARRLLDQGITPRDGHRAPPAMPVAPWCFASLDRLNRLILWHSLQPDMQRGDIPSGCPACGGPSRSGERGDRACADNSCGMRWGLRECKTCKERIPKLLPSVPKPETLRELMQDNAQPGARWLLLDALAGAHLLAERHPDNPGGDNLLCPSCGS